MRISNIKSNMMIIFLCLLIIFSGTASAKQLTVKKVIPNTDMKTGDSVSISLDFENPFNKSIPLTIQDNNILGNNGLEIQCYEYTLPENPHTGISYDFPIQAYSSGDFTLDQATVTYTNPETGTQESVRSEPVRISIKQGQSAGQVQGITKIYKCGGVSMQSTSISSSGSTSISISSGSQQDNQINMPPASPENIRQGAQDMQNIKQEMEKQRQQQQQMEKELKKLMQYIENNETFRQMNGTLSGKGYNISSRKIDLKTNISSFDYSYRDQQGRNASITGNVTDGGELKDIMLKEPESSFPYWILALFFLLLPGIYLLTKFRNKEKPVEPLKENIFIDPEENALSMLEKAVSMFENGRQEEAYIQASNAVRSYFKGTAGINELTSDEILRSIRGSRDEGYLQDVRECFMLCDLVKFAKHEPNAQDFNRVVEYARRIMD